MEAAARAARRVGIAGGSARAMNRLMTWRLLWKTIAATGRSRRRSSRPPIIGNPSAARSPAHGEKSNFPVNQGFTVWRSDDSTSIARPDMSERTCASTSSPSARSSAAALPNCWKPIVRITPAAKDTNHGKARRIGAPRQAAPRVVSPRARAARSSSSSAARILAASGAGPLRCKVRGAELPPQPSHAPPQRLARAAGREVPLQLETALPSSSPST